MKVHKFLVFVYAFIIAVSLSAQNKQAIIDTANQQYANNNFEEAIKNYEQILDSGYEAVEVYFNLGNAYYKSNRLTQAIINYERALRLAPDDDEIMYNLEIARQNVVDKIEIIPRLFIYDWIDAIINLYATDNWAVISIFSFVSCLIFLLFYFFTGKLGIKKMSFWLALLLIIISILSFLFAAKQKTTLEKHDSAIVYSSSVTVKSSPDESGNSLFVLHEGTKISIEDSVHNWLEIRLVNGNKGWLHRTDVVIL